MLINILYWTMLYRQLSSELLNNWTTNHLEMKINLHSGFWSLCVRSHCAITSKGRFDEDTVMHNEVAIKDVMQGKKLKIWLKLVGWHCPAALLSLFYKPCCMDYFMLVHAICDVWRYNLRLHWGWGKFGIDANSIRIQLIIL